MLELAANAKVGGGVAEALANKGLLSPPIR